MSLNLITSRRKSGRWLKHFRMPGILLAAGLGTPFVVDLGHFAGGVAIFDELDFGFVVGVCHALFLRSIPQYSTTAGRGTSTSRCTGNLENKALVVLLQGDALAVKVLEEGDRIFAGEAGQLLETSNIDQAAAKWGKLRGESAKRGRVDEQVVAAHADDGLVSLQRCYEAAHVGLFYAESLGKFQDGGSGEPGLLVRMGDCRQSVAFRI